MTQAEGKARYGWLEETLEEASSRGWCVRPFCTTCGAHEFRAAYIFRAAERVGLDIPRDSRYSPNRLKDSVSGEGWQAIFEELVAAARQISPQWRGTDGLRVILMDLHPPLLRWGVAAILPDLLEGSPAGSELLAMKAHESERIVERAARDAEESPEAFAERRAEEKRLAAERHARRLDESRERNRTRVEWLSAFEALSAEERLKKLAEQPPGFALEMIPQELIPTETEFHSLQTQEREQLITLIGKRKGLWGRLRKKIEECE